MRTGVAYMAQHDPQHLKADLKDIKALGCDDVLLAAQENDFIYKQGALNFFPAIAEDLGLNPLAIFWGAFNYFGGGKSSQFLLDFPEAHQINRDGSYNPAGCYNNPAVVKQVQKMIDCVAKLGFTGYFIDEPSPLECYCSSCRKIFQEKYSACLDKAGVEVISEFRRQSVIWYVGGIAAYIQKNYPQMQTLCCIMPQDKFLWKDISRIKGITSLGTDIYWANEDIDAGKVQTLIQEIAADCTAYNKQHHQWLQCWGVQKGNEQRIQQLGEIILAQNPNALYVWAYKGQAGISETCEDPQLSWDFASKILKKAKGM
jgi:hypothetical protein